MAEAATSSQEPRRRRRTILAFAADVVAVLLFVAIGRRSHGAGNVWSGLLTTAAPFLIGLFSGWLVAARRSSPTDVPAGVTVWVATVSIGLVVRRYVFGDGTAIAFIVVATLTLALLIIGWRFAMRWRLGTDTGSRDHPAGEATGESETQTGVTNALYGPAKRSLADPFAG